MEDEYGYIIFDSDANPKVDGVLHQVWEDALCSAETLANVAKTSVMRAGRSMSEVDHMCACFIGFSFPNRDESDIILKVMPNRKHEILTYEVRHIREGHVG